MTTIATFSKSEEAHLMRMRLEAGGIEAFLVDENVTQMEWALLTGGVRLQVADENVDAAQALLQAQDSTPSADRMKLLTWLLLAALIFGVFRTHRTVRTSRTAEERFFAIRVSAVTWLTWLCFPPRADLPAQSPARDADDPDLFHRGQFGETVAEWPRPAAAYAAGARRAGAYEARQLIER